MMLTLLSVLAFQLEPRFTMSAAPGDMVSAQLFEMDGGLTDERRRQLLGDAVVESEFGQDFPNWGRARTISARSPDGIRIALVDAPGHERLGNKVCRASTDPRGTVDNRARAARWCASFFDPPVVTLAPATTPPPRPEVEN